MNDSTIIQRFSEIVEVVSPDNPNPDRELKMRLYEKFGSPEYWIVDLEARSIETWWQKNRYVRLENANNTIEIRCLLAAATDISGLFEFDF